MLPDCCREYHPGPYGTYEAQTAVDCYLRAMESDLKYGRYDLKVIRTR
jgi:hypothetical protein